MAGGVTADAGDEMNGRRSSLRSSLRPIVQPAPVLLLLLPPVHRVARGQAKVVLRRLLLCVGVRTVTRTLTREASTCGNRRLRTYKFALG